MIRKGIFLLLALVVAVLVLHVAAVGGVYAFNRLNLREPQTTDDVVSTQPPNDSGATYTVQSGDTPISIARKLHVAYADLIKINNIDDPRKLQIGVRLKVPVKHSDA